MNGFMSIFLNNLRSRLGSQSLIHIFLFLVSPGYLRKIWWNQPFNGQSKRFEFISAIIREIKFTDVIETGTFLGSSTIALASLSECKTHSIEIDPSFLKYARRRIELESEDLDILLYEGTSHIMLPNILDTLDPEFAVLFLYLDAHWGSDLPLFHEIDSLNKWGGKFVALIDDFMIDSDCGYGYDTWGDQAISKEIIPLTAKTHLYRLSARSGLETGARRGSGIVIHDDLISKISPSTQLLLESL